MEKIQIKVQYFHGCPNSELMLKNVRAAKLVFSDYFVLTEEVFDDMYNRIEGFRGSPTLLINGNDFEDLPAPSVPNYSCRYYPCGIPSSDDIDLKLKSMLPNK